MHGEVDVRTFCVLNRRVMCVEAWIVTWEFDEKLQ